MAYLFRSIAVIGVIAFHSPTHQREPDPARTPAQTQAAAQPALGVALGGLATAREAAQAIAALDPQTRQAVLAMLTASLARTAEPERPAAR